MLHSSVKERPRSKRIIFCHIAILSSGRINPSLGSSVSYQSMLAQWKSDGLITRKCLDRNEDMYDFLSHSYIVLRKDRTLFRILYFNQSMLAQWKSDGFITRKCLDRNEDMYDFFVT